MKNGTPNWKRLRDDPAFRARMELRTRMLDAIRAFFRSRDFLEVETPILVQHPGMEPNLDPFATSLLDIDGRSHRAGLITSPEYQMKELLAAGLPRIFEITRAFRNREPWDGGMGPVMHNPEFTMLEWYRADADYCAIMDDCEALVSEVAMRCLGTTDVSFGSKTISLSAPWERLSVAEAFERFAGIDLVRGIDDPEQFKRDVIARNCPLSAGDGFDDAFFKIFLRDIEPRLGETKPTILYDYPRSMAALARIKAGDKRFAERFEVYCGGMELANAFSELNDPAEQRRRLEEEQVQRRRAGKETFGIDEQFIEAVGMMPPSAGIAFGIDRLVVLLTDARDIKDVLFFPAQDLFS